MSKPRRKNPNAAGEKPKAQKRQRARTSGVSSSPEGAAPKRGRPTEYTPELGAAICELLAMGKTLTKICEMDAMPGRTTEWRWREAHDDYRNAVARAREERSHSWAEEVVDITDDVKAEAAEVNKARLRAEMRLKVMAKHNPKQYGDKVDINVTTPLDQLTEEELIERARAQAAGLGISLAIN